MQNAYIQQMIKEIDRDKRSSEEIYTAIVSKLTIMSKGKLTDQELHTAARNLIGFCQEITDYKIKKQRDEQSKMKYDLKKAHI
ncbi:hypothetical protein [Candidatus Tisiphia endosymbiont of Temnostethus pusillus]|uniref:hypothetical protein n=2 Tax=unclassified Candidatus Tisiphia TaxID=2996318 RepID=UPI0035C89C9D